MIRFIHAADIHLDSPLKGLANRHNLPTDKILAATRDALVNLVTLAIDEKVDFVLLAGSYLDPIQVMVLKLPYTASPIQQIFLEFVEYTKTVTYK